jgi:sugar lactone lactonase YvrE
VANAAATKVLSPAGPLTVTGGDTQASRLGAVEEVDPVFDRRGFASSVVVPPLHPAVRLTSTTPTVTTNDGGSRQEDLTHAQARCGRMARPRGKETHMPELRTLIDGLDFGEGPRWHDGKLWYSDFYQHRVFTVTVDGRRETVLALDDHPSGLGWLPDGRLLVVSMQEKKVMRVEAEGAIVEHADLSAIATGRCNDMVVAADGNAYVGNFGFELWDAADPKAAALALVRPDGTVEVAADGLSFPNGSVVTPDGRTLIVGETFGRCYTAFDIRADGTLGNRRTWASVEGTAPDGCTLDADGAIWFANAGGTNVLRVKEGGEITHDVDVGQGTYACALGGDDGRTLFVVSADAAVEADVAGKGTGVIRAMRVDVPHAGLP